MQSRSKVTWVKVKGKKNIVCICKQMLGSTLEHMPAAFSRRSLTLGVRLNGCFSTLTFLIYGSLFKKLPLKFLIGCILSALASCIPSILNID